MFRLRALLLLLILSSVCAWAQKPFGWGYNANGQCNVPSDLRAVAIDGGAHHSLALRSDGTVTGWGENEFGQASPPPGLTDAVAISAGRAHSLALTSNGTIVAWGLNDAGQCDVPAVNDFIAVAAGADHSLGLRSDGTILAWGANGSRQCDVPSGLGRAKAISGGSLHSVALLEDGTIASWGDNEFGQLVHPLNLGPAKAIDAGAAHTLALLESGEIAAWGYNDYEQCDIPASLDGVASLAAGGYHSIALRTDGSIVCWGRGAQGQTSPPAKAAVAIAGGGLHSLALEDAVPTLSLAIPEVVGGSTDKLTGTLTMEPAPAEDLVVQLASSDSNVLVPRTVVIPAGATSATFKARHKRVASDLSYTIDATATPFACQATGKLLSFKAKLYFTPASMEGGQQVTLSAKLNARPLTDVDLSIDFSDPGLVELNSSITLTVSGGAVLASRQLSTVEVADKKALTATATLDGTSSSSSLTILPKPKIVSVTLVKWMYGHQRRSVKVTLNLPARANGATVALASSDAALEVPATVFVPAGMTEASFEIESSDVPELATAELTVTSGFSVVGHEVRIHPIAVSGLQLGPASLRGGDSTTCTVFLNGTVSVDTVVALSSARQATAPVPATVIVPAGSRSVYFTIATQPVLVAKALAIKAAKNGQVRQQTLRVNP
ncbi:MAG: RCC1 domain-containing protein [Fimbriimonas sp.]